jgi:hypothetical protein
MIDMAHVRVAAELELNGDATEGDRELLDEHIEEWYLALVQITQDIDQQVRTRAVELEEQRAQCLEEPNGQHRFAELHREHADWRRRARGFRSIVQRRLGQVKLERNRRRDNRYAVRLNAQFYSLVQAVRAHQASLHDQQVQPSQADLVLWEAAAQASERLATSAPHQAPGARPPARRDQVDARAISTTS